MIEWEQDFSVGMAEIDNQHKELLRLLSEVEASIAANKGWSSTHYCILTLQQFIRFHFEFEEALMRLYAFPDYEQHAEEHRQLSIKADTIAHHSLSVEENDKNIMQFIVDAQIKVPSFWR